VISTAVPPSNVTPSYLCMLSAEEDCVALQQWKMQYDLANLGEALHAYWCEKERTRVQGRKKRRKKSGCQSGTIDSLMDPPIAWSELHKDREVSRLRIKRQAVYDARMAWAWVLAGKRGQFLCFPRRLMHRQVMFGVYACT
jgi:hypothetical protein